MGSKNSHNAFFVLLLALVCFVCSSQAVFLRRAAKASLTTSNDGRYEVFKSIYNAKTVSLVSCLKLCLENDACVTFFYNNITRQCIMHSKNFLFLSPLQSGKGWRHYVTNDANGKCPEFALLHRGLNFCYSVSMAPTINFPDIKQTCSTLHGILVSVKSQEKQDYLEHILADRPVERVCIDGTKQFDGIWKYDDGTTLTYFNWDVTEPDGFYQLCLEIFTQNKWFDIECIRSDPCIFICEFKMV